MKTDRSVGYALRFLVVAIAVNLGSCSWFTGTVDPAVFDVTAADPVEPDDPLYAETGSYPGQWPLDMINAAAAWGILAQPAALTMAVPVTVAVIDSGIVAGHPDLKEALVPGYDFNLDRVIEHGVDGSYASVRHGTHVAGIIAATGDNGIGIAGVGWAPDTVTPAVRVMPLKVLEFTSSETPNGTLADVIEAILYAAALPNDSGERLNQPVAVINLSLGAPYGALYASEIAALEAACIAARDAGVVIVAASGNSGYEDAVEYPARLESVIAVGSVDFDEGRSSFSNYGETLAMVAPGGYYNPDDTSMSVASTARLVDIDGLGVPGYYRLAGTSMATPHVAGAAAVVRYLFPSWRVEQVERVLFDTAHLPTGASTAEFGAGILDLGAAVRFAWDSVVSSAVQPNAVEASDGATLDGRIRAAATQRVPSAAMKIEGATTAGGALLALFDPDSDGAIIDDILAEYDFVSVGGGDHFLRRIVDNGTSDSFTDRIENLAGESVVLAIAPADRKIFSD